MTMTIVILVGGFVVGLGAGYTLAPERVGVGEPNTVYVDKNPLAGMKVQLGVIAISSASLETAVPLYEELVAPEINDYSSTLGYDVEFEYLIDQAEVQSAIHLEKVQGFKSMGINLFLGGYFSSMAQAALSYVNENDMIMVSPMSTSPLLALDDDNLFRICPTDYVQAPAVAEMMDSFGIEAVVVIGRADAWADGIYNLFETEWVENKGHVILEKIRYAAESTEYSNYLATMDDIIVAAKEDYPVERIAVLALAIDELVVMVSQSVDYPAIREVIWMGCEGAGRNTRMIDDTGNAAVPLRIFSSTMVPTKSWKWDQFESEYYALTNQYAAFYDGTAVDGSTLLALNVLETGGTDAGAIKEHFIPKARSYFGLTGWVDLDDNGDRKPGTFEIFGYYERDGEVGFQKYGEYDGVTLQLNWDEAALAEQGIVKVGPR